jgi:hypothetical protein
MLKFLKTTVAEDATTMVEILVVKEVSAEEIQVEDQADSLQDVKVLEVLAQNAKAVLDQNGLADHQKVALAEEVRLQKEKDFLTERLETKVPKELLDVQKVSEMLQDQNEPEKAKSSPLTPLQRRGE